MNRTGICAAGLFVLGLVFGSVEPASAHNPGFGPGYFMGPGYGMMGPGYGMMGPGYGMMGSGYGMMSPGYGTMGTGYGMMGPGYGMMGYGMMPGPGMMGFVGPSRQGADLSTDDVRTTLERWLAWQGNSRLKVGDVKEESADVIVADLVTQEGSLVDRFKVDRHTGLMQRVP